jgi:hypothetical protein
MHYRLAQYHLELLWRNLASQIALGSSMDATTLSLEELDLRACELVSIANAAHRDNRITSDSHYQLNLAATAPELEPDVQYRVPFGPVPVPLQRQLRRTI